MSFSQEQLKYIRRIKMLTDDMVFTPETEQQHIFDQVKEFLEESNPENVNSP